MQVTTFRINIKWSIKYKFFVKYNLKMFDYNVEKIQMQNNKLEI